MVIRYPLKHYLHVEIAGGLDKKFSWRRVLRRAIKSRHDKFLFWFRVADVLSRKGRISKSIAKSINKRLIKNYSVEIMLGVEIAPGFIIPHPIGIVITKNCIIGSNFQIRQGSTIGVDFKGDEKIVIVDNVIIGANCTVIGTGINIGDNVQIGAMTFVNKNIPANVNCINKKSMVFLEKKV